MTKIKQLKDIKGELLSPITHEKAVYDDNGVRLDEKLSTKQDALVSGSNIKTINGQTLLGEGDIVINGGGTGDVEEAPIDDKKYVRSNGNWVEETKIDTSNFVTNEELPDVSDMLTKTEASSTYQLKGDYVTRNVNNLTNYENSVVTNSKYATKTSLNSKQDKLVSGTNIKTINGQTLLGNGNIITIGKSDGAGEIFNSYEGEDKNTANGSYSHAEGLGTIAENMGEHACGMYNNSTIGKTIYSIGNGTGLYNRKNAVEVLSDGSMFIQNVGNFNGTNFSQSIKVQDILQQKDLTDITNGLKIIDDITELEVTCSTTGLTSSFQSGDQIIRVKKSTTNGTVKNNALVYKRGTTYYLEWTISNGFNSSNYNNGSIVDNVYYLNRKDNKLYIKNGNGVSVVNNINRTDKNLGISKTIVVSGNDYLPQINSSDAIYDLISYVGVTTTTETPSNTIRIGIPEAYIGNLMKRMEFEGVDSKLIRIRIYHDREDIRKFGIYIVKSDGVYDFVRGADNLYTCSTLTYGNYSPKIISDTSAYSDNTNLSLAHCNREISIDITIMKNSAVPNGVITFKSYPPI